MATETDTASKITKTLNKIGVAVICMVVIFLYTSSNHSSSPSSQAAADPPENVIHLTTNWSEAIETGYNNRLVWHMKTPNLYWMTKVRYVDGEEKVYKLAPINFSGSTELNLKSVISQRWRIAPLDEEPLNKGKALFGELRWHREPKKNST